MVKEHRYLQTSQSRDFQLDTMICLNLNWYLGWCDSQIIEFARLIALRRLQPYTEMLSLTINFLSCSRSNDTEFIQYSVRLPANVQYLGYQY